MGRGQGRVVDYRGHIRFDYYFKGERLRPTTHYLSANKGHWREAERLLATIQLEIARGTHNPSVHFPEYKRVQRFRGGFQFTVKERLEAWLKEKRKGLSASTLRGYETVTHHHLIPALGSKRLSELRTEDVRTFVHTLAVSNQRINNILIPLRGVTADAYAEGVIERDPLQRVTGFPRNTPEVRPFDHKEVQAILGATEGEIRDTLTVGFFTGLRTSELIGLRWSDVAADFRTLFIRHVRTREESKERPKTAAGRRSVKVAPIARAALQRQAERNRGKLFVFMNPRTGEPWTHDGPLRKTAWAPALSRAGVPYRKPYAMRHTFASMALSAGESPMWVAAQLGHRDTGMVFRVYGKYIPDPDSGDGQKVERLWSSDGQRLKVSA